MTRSCSSETSSSSRSAAVRRATPLTCGNTHSHDVIKTCGHPSGLQHHPEAQHNKSVGRPRPVAALHTRACSWPPVAWPHAQHRRDGLGLSRMQGVVDSTPKHGSGTRTQDNAAGVRCRCRQASGVNCSWPLSLRPLALSLTLTRTFLSATQPSAVRLVRPFQKYLCLLSGVHYGPASQYKEEGRQNAATLWHSGTQRLGALQKTNSTVQIVDWNSEAKRQN